METETKWLSRNRYDMDPEANTDEDHESAFVRVTRTTRTAREARAWLLAHPEALHLSPDCERLIPERMTLKGLNCDIIAKGPLSKGTLTDQVALQSLIVSGAATGWWEFELYGAREELPDVDWEARSARMAAEREQEERRRAREWRGPLQWRAKLWLGRRLAGWGARMQPKDRVTAQWREGDQWVTIDNLRRPAAEQ